MWIKTETVCKLLLTEHIKCWNWDILLRFFNRRAKGWKSYVTFKNTWCNMSQQVSLISNTIRQKNSFPEAESFRGWGFTMLWKTVWVSSTNTSFLDLASFWMAWKEVEIGPVVRIIKMWNSVWNHACYSMVLLSSVGQLWNRYFTSVVDVVYMLKMGQFCLLLGGC